MLGFAQQEWKRKGAQTWCVLVAGKGPDEDLGTWRRALASAAAQLPQKRGTEREKWGVRTEWGLDDCTVVRQGEFARRYSSG